MIPFRLNRRSSLHTLSSRLRSKRWAYRVGLSCICRSLRDFVTPCTPLFLQEGEKRRVERRDEACGENHVARIDELSVFGETVHACNGQLPVPRFRLPCSHTLALDRLTVGSYGLCTLVETVSDVCSAAELLAPQERQPAFVLPPSQPATVGWVHGRWAWALKRLMPGCRCPETPTLLVTPGRLGSHAGFLPWKGLACFLASELEISQGFSAESVPVGQPEGEACGFLGLGFIA